MKALIKLTVFFLGLAIALVLFLVPLAPLFTNYVMENFSGTAWAIISAICWFILLPICMTVLQAIADDEEEEKTYPNEIKF